MRVGVIGVGSMGQHHARVYKELGADLVGVADINRKRADEIAKRFGTQALYNYNDLLEKGLDAVSIAVPTVLHKEVALAVIDAGVNLLVEKPIADTVENAVEMITASERARLKLMVGHIERFNPAVQKLKDVIDKGVLGDLLVLAARRVGPFDPRIKDVGIIVDLATHDIDIAEYIIGREPVKIFAKLNRIRNEKGDCAVIVLDYGDVSASIEVNWFTPHKVRSLVITGTEGIAYVDYLEQTLTIHNARDVIAPEIMKEEPLKLELKHFLESIKADKKPMIDGEKGLKTLEVAIKIEKLCTS